MKISIEYLKKLVVELDSLVLEAEKIKSENELKVNSSPDEYWIALNKAAGICLGVSAEGNALISDIQKAINSSFVPSIKDDLLSAALQQHLTPYKVGQKN